MSRLIISFYDNFDTAHEAVAELMDKGFCHDTISLIAHQAACERTWGIDRKKSWFYQSQPHALSLPGIGSVLVSGFLAGDLNITDATRRSLVRVLQQRMVPEVDANAYTEGVRRRGILVLVNAERTNSSRILSILDRFCPVDIQDLADFWRKKGWTHFDDTARPLKSNGFSWPNCITSSPEDGLFVDEGLNSWPQSIVGRKKSQSKP